MQLYVPYTQILSATLKSLTQYEFTIIKMDSDDSYLEYFQTRWQDASSFINCEHDTVFHSQAIEELAACPEPWCAFAVDGNDVTIGGGLPPTLSTLKPFSQGGAPPLCLMKFDQNFILRFPHLWADAKGWSDLPSWHYLDAYLDWYTKGKDVVCHQHYPNVINANGMYREKIKALRGDL
jgi:hypothetical protein